MLVIGSGNSAFEEGLFLTRFASQVTIMNHGPAFRASTILQEKVAGKPRMLDTRLDSTVQRFRLADGHLSGVEVLNTPTDQLEEYHPDGVFVFIGVSPNGEFLLEEIERDRRGFVTPDSSMRTSLKGVFAAGDVRAGATAQAASAAGEDAAVALRVREHLSTIA